MNKTTTSVCLIMILALLSESAFAEETSRTLTRVEPIKVCMVNNEVFGKDQIPVRVDGKTYYGCCDMCKKTLSEKREHRVAIDPVSGKGVDKAKAVIGATKEGKTLYFESEKTFRKYNSKFSKSKE